MIYWFIDNLKNGGYSSSTSIPIHNRVILCSFHTIKRPLQTNTIYKYVFGLIFNNEPRHDKTNKMSVHPVKTQISLASGGPGWSESSLGGERGGSVAYMWSLPIWRKSPDMAPHFMPSRGSKNPDIYEFRFFAFFQKLKLVFRSPQTFALSKFTTGSDNRSLLVFRNR